jgi:hypothetical protein
VLAGVISDARAGSPDTYLTAVDGTADFVSLDCYTSTYGVVLGTLGYDPRVLGDEWGYQYAASTDRRPDTLPFPLPRLYREKFHDRLAAWFGISERRTAHRHPDGALASALSALRHGVPVIVETDTFHLRHTGFVGRLHYPHRIVLAGCAADRVYFVDAYRGSSHRGWLPIPELLAAMSRDHLPADALEHPQITTFELVTPAGGPRPPDGGRILDVLRDNVTRYLSGSAEAPQLGGRQALDAYLDDLCAAQRSTRDLGGEHFVDYLAFFGEVASQRQLNSAFLELAASSLAVPALTDLAVGFAALSAEWLKMRSVYFAGSTGRRPVTDVVARLIARMARAVERETALVQDLDRALTAGSAG